MTDAYICGAIRTPFDHHGTAFPRTNAVVDTNHWLALRIGWPEFSGSGFDNPTMRRTKSCVQNFSCW